MFASKDIRKLAGILKIAALSSYVSLGMISVTSAMDLADSPLFLTGGAKPNLIMAIDGSGSMDAELLLSSNDGAAWWRTGAAAPCTAGTAGSFIGCGSDGAGNAIVANKVNFNHAGNADATWKKFIYLFPNGSGNTREDKRRYGDGDHDHYPVPPLGAFAWSRSPEYNAAYFDPTDTYLPWPNGGDYTFTNASATAAEWDPVYNGAGTINLTRDIAASGTFATTDACSGTTPALADNWYFRVYTGMTIPAGTCIWINGRANWERVGHGSTATGSCVVGTAAGCAVRNMATSTDVAAFQLNTNSRVAIRYYPATVFLPAATGGIPGYTATPANDGLAPDGTTLYRYEIKSDNFAVAADYTTAINNFANWFQFYRKRHQALRAGLGRSFYTISNMRVAGFRIDQASSTGPDVTMRDIDTPAQRSALYNNFYYDWTDVSGTPNRMGVTNIIRNFRRTNAGAPVTHSCQRNFGMLFTDGFSNPPAAGDNPTGADGNVDAVVDPPRRGIAPYTDGTSNTMADHAMYAYVTRLRTDAGFPAGKVSLPAACSDAVHSPSLDCNPDLHMNFYAVTLGARGLLFNPDAPVDPYSTTIAWPTTFPQRHPNAVDDIWHATINGRGQLLNASKATELADKLSTVLNSIIDTEGSASAASVNSGAIQSDTRLFQASFNTRNWSGELRSFVVQANGALGGSELATIPDPDDREILTMNSAGVGVAFRWADIGTTRQTSLKNGGDDTLGTDRLEYLRGVRTRELPGGIFRKRDTVLGDIVDSAPVFVGAPPYRYPDIESEPYSTFKSQKANRQGMIYVGGNDGMLHAFKVNSATDAVEEAFAYVPGAVYANLHLLTASTYSHKFYVDGTPSVVDAFFDNAWHSVLIGGLNKGGKGIYALDVTNPTEVTEDNAAQKVLWERTNLSTDFGDLGYTFSRPTIARVKWGAGGKWVAIFGNGYDSSSGKAVLYVVDVANGTLLNAMDVSTTASPVPAWTNGLSTPGVVDLQGDGTADYVFAGDLYGNMWKFDLTSGDPLSWTSVNLFAAGTSQPITGRPQVAPGPNGLGMVVLFGTGKFLETADRSSPGGAQTFYGIHDANGSSYTAPAKSDLLQQTVLAPTDGVTLAGGMKVRVTSENAMVAGKRGWYLDLPTSGERQVSDPVLRNGRVVFTTMIPSTDPCSYGGGSWLMDMNAVTGSRLAYTPFDLDGNSQFNELDYVTVTVGGEEVRVPASGIYNDALMSRPAFVSGPDAEIAYTTDTGGDVNTNRVNPGPAGVGRQSWRQLR